MAKKKKKMYVCKENGEVFVTSGNSFEEAQKNASMYGGECIRELTAKEYASANGNGGFAINV